MASRPTEITEEDFDGGTDIQGLPWGVWDIPIKEDFREKRYLPPHLPTTHLQCQRLWLPNRKTTTSTPLNQPRTSPLPIPRKS